MTDFSVGGGEKWPKARALPVGAKVKIAEARVVTSRFEQEIQSGPRKGSKQPRLQLLVVYEALDDGTTVAYTINNTTTPAAPYKAGQRFVQYYGGVYAKDGGGYNFTPAGSAYGFIAALKALGVEPTGKLEDYAGTIVGLVQVQVRSPGGIATQAVPGAVHGRAAPAPAPAATPAPVAQAAVQAAPAAPLDAFRALPKADRDNIMDALASGPVAPADLVEAGIVKTTTAAEAILAAAPKKTNPLKK